MVSFNVFAEHQIRTYTHNLHKKNRLVQQGTFCSARSWQEERDAGRGSVEKVQKRLALPPDNFDHRKQSNAAAGPLRDEYSELQDLFESGALLLLPRSHRYIERRTDGYREPEQIFVYGTAHISLPSARQNSAADVRRIIQVAFRNKMCFEAMFCSVY